MNVSESLRVTNAFAIALLFLACWSVLPAQDLPPAINEGGVTEAAQFIQMVAPGSIASVFGQNLANGTLEADTIPLSLELGGVRVEVNGVPAPLYFVSARQINFQIPFETEPGEAAVVVFRGGVASEPETVQVKTYVPAAFKNPATGEAIVVVNGTSQLISAENPAVAGQVVTVFMNGYGSLDNPPATGAAASADPLARTTAVPRVTLGDQEVTVYFAGLTPGLVGLGQLDLGLPAEFPENFASTLPLNIDFDGFAAPLEGLPLDLPTPSGPDVGIEITNVNPQSIFPGDSFEVDYTLFTPNGYVGEAEVGFFLELRDASITTLAVFNVELTGSDLVLSRELATHASMFPGSYILQCQVLVPGDVDFSNNLFTVEEPFILEAASGDPHDIGVEITKVSPAQIAPGDALSFEYTLLNLTEYSGPVRVTFQLSTSSFGRILLTEQVTLEGQRLELIREVPTPEDLQLETFRPVMRVEIENDTDPSNNLVVFGEVEIVVSAAQAVTLSQALGEPPPIRDLTEGNLSEWQLEAYRGSVPVNPGVRLGSGATSKTAGAAPVVGKSFLTGVAPTANRLTLRYPRTAALDIHWDLSASQSLEFWLSLGSNTSLQKGHPRIILRSPGGSRILTRFEQQDWTSNLFQRLSVPLSGDESWAATNRGEFDSRQVTSFELDFQFDQPGRVAVSLDGVQFK